MDGVRAGSRAFARIAPTPDEVRAAVAGDDVVPDPDTVMDRAFTVAAPPDAVWPWFVQLGKRRAGWYLPRSVDRFVPRPRRAARTIDPRWQGLAVGDVVPDYGGRDETFTVEVLEPPHVLVLTSWRGRMRVSWAITLTPYDAGATRVHLRLRLGPVRRPWLADTAGGLLDLLTIAGLERGLAERVAGR
jgi:hypothetical protein